MWTERADGADGGGRNRKALCCGGAGEGGSGCGGGGQGVSELTFVPGLLLSVIFQEGGCSSERDESEEEDGNLNLEVWGGRACEQAYETDSSDTIGERG